MRRLPLDVLRRHAGIVTLAAAAVAAAAPPAAAACPQGAACRTVTVPLDRSGAVPGTVRLAVARDPGPSRRPPVVALTGGPGQSARDAIDVYRLVVGRRRDVIAFDSRGSGASGLIRCPRLQRSSVRDGRAAAACARALGERRRFYTAVDHAEDVEAVRAALGAERIALVGVSYGTKVAQVYARLYPQRVDRLVLDSVVPAEGSSALSQEVLSAMPRVLGADLPRVGRLVAALRARPRSGRAYDRHGRPRRVTADPAAIFDVLLAGDFNPVLREALPAAAGDRASLLRLVRAARRSDRLPRDPREFSAGLYAAASCEEIAFPWSPDAPPAERERQALEAAAQARFLAPFAAADLPALDWLSLCLHWPRTPGSRPLPAPADVPALLLGGDQDLRTPLEDMRRVRALMPRARLLRLRGHGHSVTGSSGCARRAVRAFLRGRALPRRCPRLRAGYEHGVRRPPLVLRGAEPGRTLRAVRMTLEDAELALDLEAAALRVGGLRGGSVAYRSRGLHRLRGYVYVPGIRVSTSGNRIRVWGPRAADGRLVLAGGRLRGRLGRHRVG